MNRKVNALDPNLRSVVNFVIYSKYSELYETYTYMHIYFSNVRSTPLLLIHVIILMLVVLLNHPLCTEYNVSVEESTQPLRPTLRVR